MSMETVVFGRPIVDSVEELVCILNRSDDFRMVAFVAEIFHEPLRQNFYKLALFADENVDVSLKSLHVFSALGWFFFCLGLDNQGNIKSILMELQCGLDCALDFVDLLGKDLNVTFFSILISMSFGVDVDGVPAEGPIDPSSSSFAKEAASSASISSSQRWRKVLQSSLEYCS